MRYLFSILLIAHGLIHWMGFLKAFRYAEISQLTQPISKPAGLFWLITSFLWLVAALLIILHKDFWWMVAAPALILSQWLILSSWQDAKYGTIANVLVLIAGIFAFGQWSYNRLISIEIESFLPTKTQARIVTGDQLSTLPAVVQNWLKRSNVVGKEAANFVHLNQKGQMKTKPDGNWLPFKAEQYFTVEKPGFIWTADIQAAPMIHIVGRDKYEHGKGNMLIKIQSLFPIANATGPEIDQGSMLRYLAEIGWFPSAALNNYIQWDAVDSTSAKATMQYGAITASGIFRFNKEGDLLSFEAKRYYDRKEGATLEDWWIENKTWKEMQGIRIPIQSEVTWKLKNGDFNWLKLEITAIEYDGQ